MRWINGEYIRAKSAEELYELLKKKLLKEKYIDENIDRDYLLKIIQLYKTRFKTSDEFLRLTECFFKDEYKVDEKGYKKHLSKKESKGLIKKYAEHLKALEKFDAKNIENICRKLSEELGIKASKIIHPTRVAISGLTVGAGLFEMMELLGKEKVIRRLEKV